MTKHFLVQGHVQRLLGSKILINAPAETNPYLFAIIGTRLSKAAGGDKLLFYYFFVMIKHTLATESSLLRMHVDLLHTPFRNRRM